MNLNSLSLPSILLSLLSSDRRWNLAIKSWKKNSQSSKDQLLAKKQEIRSKDLCIYPHPILLSLLIGGGGVGWNLWIKDRKENPKAEKPSYSILDMQWHGTWLNWILVFCRMECLSLLWIRSGVYWGYTCHSSCGSQKIVLGLFYVDSGDEPQVLGFPCCLATPKWRYFKKC